MHVGEGRESGREEPYACGFVSELEGKPGFGSVF